MLQVVGVGAEKVERKSGGREQWKRKDIDDLLNEVYGFSRIEV